MRYFKISTLLVIIYFSWKTAFNAGADWLAGIFLGIVAILYMLENQMYWMLIAFFVSFFIYMCGSVGIHRDLIKTTLNSF